MEPTASKADSAPIGGKTVVTIENVTHHYGKTRARWTQFP